LKVEKIVITDIKPEDLPAVLEVLQAKQPSTMDEVLRSMGMGFGFGLPMILEKWAGKESNLPKINKVPVTLTVDATEAEGIVTISYERPDFTGPVNCQIPAAKCPPVAQLKAGTKLLLVFRGNKPFEGTVLGVELPKRERKAPAAGDKDKEKP
jgi:hypothetical protein